MPFGLQIRSVRQGFELPHLIATRHEDGVHHEKDLGARAVELRPYRIDEEGHVAVDDGDGAVAAFPTVALGLGIVDPDARPRQLRPDTRGETEVSYHSGAVAGRVRAQV